MAIYVYNTKQQALNAKKIAELFSFSSNDFGGLVSNEETPIISDEENQKWSWNSNLQNTQITFIGGGVNIRYDVTTDEFSFHPVTPPFETYSMWGLDITIPDSNSSIVTNNYNLAEIVEVQCSSIAIDNLYIIINYPSGNPHDKEYYEYSLEGEYVLSEDTSIQEGKTYYYKLENEAFKVTNATFSRLEQSVSFEYYGNTVWISENRFFIPFCYRDTEGHQFSMLFNRDKTGYESFLTARTYYHLLSELGDKFVFRVGGPTLGDIGDLNITDNYITNKANDSGVKIDGPVLTNLIASNNLDNMLLVNSETGKVFKTNSDYIIPINHGGTSANEINIARRNLGFYYGTDDPNEIELVPRRFNSSDSDEEAVYFKLL